jgi:hypothetical protein
MSITIITKNNANPPGGTWTEANLGDDTVGSIVELSATAVTISASGTSDSTDDGTIAYQTVSGAQDIQIICLTPTTYTGIVESYTFFGVQLREALTGDPVILSCLSAYTSGGTRTKHRLTTNGSYVTHNTGDVALTRPKYLAITYDHSLGEVKYWESSTGVSNEYSQIGTTVSITLSFPVYAALYGTSHNNVVISIAAFTNCSVSNTLTISQAAPPGARNLGYIMDGTLSEFTAVGNPDHGMRLSNNTRAGLSSTAVIIASGGGGVTTDCDSRLTAAGYVSPTNANGVGDTVNPRKNTYFLENRLNWKKDYCEMQGTGTPAGSGYPSDKPRCWNYMHKKTDVGEALGSPLRWDKTFWLGFSVFVPSNWEHETLNIGNWDQTDWSMFPMHSSSASTTIIEFSLWGKEAGKTQWGVTLYYNHLNVYDTASPTIVIDCGDVATDGDLGKWTDFVIKMRLNPFTVTTNASTIPGGRNESYDGNRGIFEVWKTTGAVDGNGDRAFTKVYSRVNLPVGLVPQAGVAPIWLPRIYRGGFNPTGTRDPRARSGVFGSTGAGNPDDDGYMFLGYDCIYMGDEELNGTGFSDVNPGRLTEPV